MGPGIVLSGFLRAIIVPRIITASQSGIRLGCISGITVLMWVRMLEIIVLANIIVFSASQREEVLLPFQDTTIVYSVITQATI